MTAAPLTVSNARLWSPAGIAECSIHIADGRVVRLAGPAELQGSEGERVIDARERVVTPGFIDAHMHAYAVHMNGNPLERMSYIAHGAARRLSDCVRRGFTTVRDVAGGDAGLARAIEDGLIQAPRYLYTGTALSQTGGHGDFRSAETLHSCGCDLLCEVVDGVESVQKAVRERFRTGAHAIKLLVSGGVVSPTDPLHVPQYSADEVRAACVEAARRSSYVAAHAYSSEAIEHAVSNGVRSIEHGNFVDQPTAALMAERGAYLVPTLIAYDAIARRGEQHGLSEFSLAKNREVLDSGMRAIEIARTAGVPVGFGSDLMSDLHEEQLAGLRLQHEVQGTAELLTSLTRTNAALLQRADLGSLEPGSAADLLIFERDPIEDASVLWDTREEARLVISRGLPLAP